MSESRDTIVSGVMGVVEKPFREMHGSESGFLLPHGAKGVPQCKGDNFEVGDLVRPHSLSTASLNGMVGCVRGFVGEVVQ
eukprot:3443208-Pyramimonas_sp.AAC.1